MEDKLVRVANFVYLLRAYLTKGRLEAEGIECFLANENFRNGVHINMEDGVDLMVKASDLAKAKEIISKIEKEYGSKAIQDDDIHIRKILVPVDFSDFSIAASRFAIQLASNFKAEIELFHAYYLPSLDSTSLGDAGLFTMTIEEHLNQMAQNALNNLGSLVENLNNELREKGLRPVKITPKLENGFANDEIIREFKNYHPDLIIMGLSGQDNLLNKLYGSVTNDVIENVQVPVLSIPRKPDLLSITDFKQVVYLTNFDKSDIRAIHKLLYLISPFRMAVHVVHISGSEVSGWEGLKLEGLKSLLTKSYVGPEVKVEIIRSDQPLIALEDYIQKNNINLIAMLSKKSNFFSKLFKSNLDKEILFRSKVPILSFH